MLRCTVLLPVRYNEGDLIEKGKLTAIVDEIVNLAGGITSCNIVVGLWKNPQGKLIKDELEGYFVCINAEQLNDLRAILQRASVKLEQDCIYLDYHEVHLDLIHA